MTAPRPSEAPSATRSRQLACVAFLATGGFLLLVTALHGLKRELNPSWRVVSEYGIGDHGWIMSVAFLLLATGCASLGLALRGEVGSTVGRVGLGLLAVTTLGLVLSALATTDPITASADELTTHGRLHGLGALVGIPGLLLAATLITRDLVGRPVWRDARRWLLLTAGGAWASIALYAVAMLTMYDGGYGPDVRIGWPNRLIVVSYGAWLMVTAASTASALAERLPSSASSPRQRSRHAEGFDRAGADRSRVDQHG
jgi:hypothetical protein